jgi:hypothetical protein
MAFPLLNFKKHEGKSEKHKDVNCSAWLVVKITILKSVLPILSTFSEDIVPFHPYLTSFFIAKGPLQAKNMPDRTHLNIYDVKK